MVLNERERWIHYFSVLTMFGMAEGLDRSLIMIIINKIRGQRCRKLTNEEVEEIIIDMKEEQLAGRAVMDEIIWNSESHGIRDGKGYWGGMDDYV